MQTVPVRVYQMLPTQVGMNRDLTVDNSVTPYAPHAGGDEPILDRTAKAVAQCSPRRWG